MGNVKYKAYYSGAIYHIYNRGNNKQNIFQETNDFANYLKRLKNTKEKYNVSLLAYVLMPNHLHLEVRQNSEVPIYKFISSLHTSYAIYFNKKYGKVGHLFQGRFKQRIVKDDDDLLYLSCYIHLNPEADGLVQKVEDYQWSSYRDYIGLRSGTLCDRTLIADLFQSQGLSFAGVYRKFVEENKKTILENKLIREFLKDSP